MFGSKHQQQHKFATETQEDKFAKFLQDTPKRKEKVDWCPSDEDLVLIFLSRKRRVGFGYNSSYQVQAERDCFTSK